MNRHIITAIAGPLAAAGILAGSITLGPVKPALAQPTTSSECSSMAMPDGQAAPANPNPLTRAGQVGVASNPSSPTRSMEMGCSAVGHG